MIVIYLIVSFVCIFVAGMHYAIWDQYKEQNSLYWSIMLGLVGIYDLISMIGHITK